MLSSTLIRLRWPAMLLGVMVLAALLASFRWSFWYGHDTIIPGHSYVYGALVRGKLFIQSMNHGQSLNPTFRIEPATKPYVRSLAFSERNAAAWIVRAFFPTNALHLWAVVLPLAVVGVAGFAARRRRREPGCCKRCRYPLHGASICPECGTGAAPVL